MKKRIAIVVLIALTAGAWFFGRQWYRTEKGMDPAVLKIYGTIDIRDAGLAFVEQERVAEVLVEEGERVAKGQVLARLKTDRLKESIREMTARVGAQVEVVKKLKAGNRPQEVEQARAEVDAARLRAANTERVVSRLERTAASGATSQQDLDDASSRLEVEKAQLEIRQKALNLVLEGPRAEDIAAAGQQLEALEAGLAQLNLRFADMTLIAPADGIIQSRLLEPGEMAGPNMPVFILALNDPKWVRAYVPEPDLGRIRQGMKARVLSDSFPGQPFEGWIGFISPVAEFTPRAVQTEDLRTKLVYETRVFVPDEDDRLRLGMPVTVILDRDHAEAKTAPAAQPGSGRGGA